MTSKAQTKKTSTLEASQKSNLLSLYREVGYFSMNICR